MAHMIAGVATRSYDELLDELAGGLGLSKSSVSRVFAKGSQEALDHLNTRDLSSHTWCAVQPDAIYFAKKSIVVALGINGIGEKVILGLIEGNTECATVCGDLLKTLVSRGIRQDKPFLFVIDGGKGMRRAIKDIFGENFPVQRCLIHKARNIEVYIPERAHLEFRRRWRRMRSYEQHADAIQELSKLKDWLSTINKDAVKSLEEAGDELLTAQRLGASPYLRRCLTNTNAIETIFGRVRAISNRVKNWHTSSDQRKRWVAVGLLSTEKNCIRIHGYFDCAKFITSITKKILPQTQMAA